MAQIQREGGSIISSSRPSKPTGGASGSSAEWGPKLLLLLYLLCRMIFTIFAADRLIYYHFTTPTQQTIHVSAGGIARYGRWLIYRENATAVRF